MPATARFTLDDIEGWLSAREVGKGQAYLDAVSNLEIGDQQINARVQGTAARPYEVTVVLASNGRNLPTRLQCSCPVGGHCKHVAATLLKTVAMRDRTDQPTPAALEWVEALRQLSAGPAKTVAVPKLRQRLFWGLSFDPQMAEFRIGCARARTDEDGLPVGKLNPWGNFEQALSRPFNFVDEEDVAIIRLLLTQSSRHDHYRSDIAVVGRHGPEILRRLLETERFFAEGFAMVPLAASAARPARISWRQDERGLQRAHAQAEPAITWALPFDPPWYVDAVRHEAGELKFDMPSNIAARILVAPPLNETDMRLVSAVLAEAAPGVAPPSVVPVREIDVAPTPVLRLATLHVPVLRKLHDYPSNTWGMELDIAQPAFRYGETLFELSDKHEFVVLPDGDSARIRRSPTAETRWLMALRETGLKEIPRNAVQFHPHSIPHAPWVLDSREAWSDFMAEAVPRLRAAGWEIVIPADFRHHVLQVEAWEAEVTETESGWFDLDMGIVVEGQRLPLAPLLAELFHRDPRWLDSRKLRHITDAEKVELLTPEGNRVRVAAERIKPLATTLIDLFDGLPKGNLRIPKLDAPRLAALDGGWRIDGMEAVQRMADKLAGLSGVTAVAPPAGFRLELRQYQLEGLAWLQYLRENELAGILADDMGLGKTAQTLAHLLLEKQAGRLDRPALIVLPTSLIFNWKAEVARFAPDLSVLSLQGKARKERFAEIPRYDLVLTTYPLLWRDVDDLARHEYHVLILDEAQMVKNAASKGAAVVRQLKARHRLCLTGTPLENHLGELWSQFDFLLPGFLGDARTFTKAWRTPIEKRGDRLRAELLARRIRPFVLRRRKEDVAKELPPKTVIPRTVELEAGQRDLYETVRSAMDKRVRDEIASKGFARSQIIILDALLKLRQVCCDPRLVKSEAAQKVKERAKLDQLMGMLPELVEEGRKVLVFSQFTTMLALIEDELTQANLPYALLTGDTRDREQQIRRFQEGEVPIFLISLKAGGVGLNLTAADTVIHYDPWWNPAVENQATDRAHRLGQTKPVFVYKLIVAGSIEEKIIALQDRKADLAAGILSDDRAGEVKFSETDLQALLAPLPPLK